MSEASANVMAVVACDLERSPIGTASRLREEFCGEMVLRRTVGRLLAVRGVERVILMAPANQVGRVREAVGGMIGVDRVEVMELLPRPEEVDRRVRTGRAWNLYGWRGGAGQWTVFDEDYHPRRCGGRCSRRGQGGASAHMYSWWRRMRDCWMSS